jgi:D-glycero-D-manno-heptose 1,7-bisphosphate phosphatase
VGGVRSAIFLDRDGTLNVKPPEHEYVTSVEGFVWLPGAREAVAQLARAGFVLTVVSNQRGVARGLVSLETLGRIEERIQNDLRPYGCAIASFRYCVHAADACDCRKPKPGMLLELAEALNLDLGASWIVGDAESDVRAGEAAGCRTAVVGDASSQIEADVQARTLLEASDLILARARPQSEGTALANPATSSSYVRRNPS